MRRDYGALQVRAKALLGVAIATLAAGFVSSAQCADIAGTTVVNRASITFALDGQTTSIASNVVTTKIDEILEVTLSPKSSGALSVPPKGLEAFGVPIIVTNHGNGTEAFYVKASVTDPAEALWVAIDVDGNGAYDPAVDIALPADGKTPPLAPGASLSLILRFPAAPTKDGTITVDTQAVSGTGPYATFLPGAGDNGSNAIVGHVQSATIPFTLGTTTQSITPATLTKSQTVLAPDGSANPVSGAVITYRLALATTGTETLSGAEIADPIPAGTTYVPASLQIDGVAASDAKDSDAAQYDGTAIRVAMGDISQPTTRVVTFQVRIQ